MVNKTIYLSTYIILIIIDISPKLFHCKMCLRNCTLARCCFRKATDLFGGRRWIKTQELPLLPYQDAGKNTPQQHPHRPRDLLKDFRLRYSPCFPACQAKVDVCRGFPRHEQTTHRTQLNLPPTNLHRTNAGPE